MSQEESKLHDTPVEKIKKEEWMLRGMPQMAAQMA